jgi:hypothetical protein
MLTSSSALQLGDAALLRRERLAQRVGALALGDHQPAVDLALHLAEQGPAAGHVDPARPRIVVDHPPVAARPGRPLGRR